MAAAASTIRRTHTHDDDDADDAHTCSRLAASRASERASARLLSHRRRPIHRASGPPARPRSPTSTTRGWLGALRAPRAVIDHGEQASERRGATAAPTAADPLRLSPRAGELHHRPGARHHGPQEEHPQHVVVRRRPASRRSRVRPAHPGLLATTAHELTRRTRRPLVSRPASSADRAGDMRFTDTRQDEQGAASPSSRRPSRSTTSWMSRAEDGDAGHGRQRFLINIIDSPGRRLRRK